MIQKEQAKLINRGLAMGSVEIQSIWPVTVSKVQHKAGGWWLLSGDWYTCSFATIGQILAAMSPEQRAEVYR